MYDELAHEIIQTLSLRYNRCFNKISRDNDLFIIENCNCNTSSIYECRELLEIEAKLLEYDNYLDLEISLEKIVITFK